MPKLVKHSVRPMVFEAVNKAGWQPDVVADKLQAMLQGKSSSDGIKIEANYDR